MLQVLVVHLKRFFLTRSRRDKLDPIVKLAMLSPVC